MEIIVTQTRQGRRGLIALVCLLGLAGCYRTSELTTPSPEPGTRIVAALTSAGSVQMEPLIGADVVGLEARVAEARAEEWELSLIRVDYRGGSSTQWNGERVAFPTAALRDARERRLDALRTGAFSAGLGVTLVVLARNFMWAWIAGDPGPRDPDPAQ